MRSPLFHSTLERVGLLPWARIRNGKVQILLPEWIYDLLVFLLFPFNWILGALPSRVPSPANRADWPLDPDLVPSRLPSPSAEVAKILRRRDDTRLDDREIWSLFDSLAAPGTNEVIGNWRGKVVFTGGWLDLPGVLIEKPVRRAGGDWGKRYFTPYRGDPLLFILWNRIVFPAPLWGSVSLPEISFRGKTGAAMTYDHQPWKDHFRILDDGKTSGRRMLLGNWMSREKNGGWFTLEEMPELDAAMPDLFLRLP